MPVTARGRSSRLLISLVVCLAARLLFVGPQTRNGSQTTSWTSQGARGDLSLALAAVPQDQSALMKKGLAWEALETPPDDMDGLDIIRARVAPLMESDKGWSRISDDHIKRQHLASKFDPDVAFERLSALADWQQEMFPIDQALIQPEIETNKLILHGEDKLGHPVLYTVVRRHNRFERDMKGCISHVVSMVEEAISQMPPGIGKLLLVFDARGLGWAQLDLKMIKEAIYLLQRLYPVRAYKLYAVGLPSVFNYLWTFAKKFLDPLSASKVAFLKDMDELVEFVDADQVPDAVRSKVGEPLRAEQTIA